MPSNRRSRKARAAPPPALAFAPWLERPTYEVFPAAGIESLVAEHLPARSRVAITHSPRQGALRSVEIAAALAAKGYRPVVHLAAKGIASQSTLDELVGRAREVGIEEAFVVGGDSASPSGPFTTASELLAAIVGGEDPFPRIGVAGHPEGHPHASEDALLEALAEKQRLGAAYLVTQMCFDAQAWLRWAEAIERAGIVLPLSVGVPGVVSRRKLLEIGLRAGAGPSVRALRSQRGFARRALGGVYAPEQLLGRLAEQRGPNASRIDSVHVFTFNSLDPTAAWVERVRATPSIMAAR